MATLPSTLIFYLCAVLVWQWQNWLCLSESCLRRQRRFKVPPNARSVPSYDILTQKVNVGGKFTNRFLLCMETLRIGKMWRSAVANSPKEGLMFTANKRTVGRLWSPTSVFMNSKEKSAKSKHAIKELHHINPEVSKTTIHEAVTEIVGYRILCARWVSKILTDNQKMKKEVVRWRLSSATEGRRWVSVLHFDWRGNMVVSPHCWIQATDNAIAPYAFPTTKISKFYFQWKKL